MRYWAFSIIILLLASAAWAESFGFTSQGAATITVNQTWCYSNRDPQDVYGASGGEVLTELWAFLDPPDVNYTSKMGVYEWTRSDSCVTDSVVTSGSYDNPSTVARWVRYDIADKILIADDTISAVVGNFQTGTWTIYQTATTDAGEEHNQTDLPASLICNSRDDWRLSLFGCLNQEGNGVIEQGHVPTSYTGGTNWTTPGNILGNEGIADLDDACAIYSNTGQDILATTSLDHSLPTSPAPTIDSITVVIQGNALANAGNREHFDLSLSKDGTTAIQWWEQAFTAVQLGCGGNEDNLSFTMRGDTLGTWSGAGVNDSLYVLIRDNDTQASALHFDGLSTTIYFTPGGEAADEVSPRRRKLLTGAVG